MADIVKLIYKGDEMAQGGGGSTPMASTTVIGTVRKATSTELNNWTSTWSQWEVLVTTPAQVKEVASKKATTSAIGVVRWATDAEAMNWDYRGSEGELLVVTPWQIKYKVDKNIQLEFTSLNEYSEYATWPNDEQTLSYTFDRDWFAIIEWDHSYANGSEKNYIMEGSLSDNIFLWTKVDVQNMSVNVSWTQYWLSWSVAQRDIMFVHSWSRSFHILNTSSAEAGFKSRIHLIWFVGLK